MRVRVILAGLVVGVTLILAWLWVMSGLPWWFAAISVGMGGLLGLVFPLLPGEPET